MRRLNLLVDLGLVAVCALAAALLGQDANWDQLQYHFWYPWQLFHGGFNDPDLYGGRFQNPLSQVPFYVLANWVQPHVAQVLLGAMAGVAAVLTRRIAMRVLPFTGGGQVASSAGAAVLAVVAAGFRSELGTSYSDVLLASLLLGGLLLVLRTRSWPTALAGLLAGAAVGLKYTSAPFAVAAVVALLVLPERRMNRIGLWVAGAGLGWIVTGAAWAWNLWRTYDSPVFPFWNTIFGSRWFPGTNLTDERYGVSGLGGWLTWPWDMATGSARVLDLPVRDPRWLLLIAALVLLAIGWRKLTPPLAAVVAFTLVGLAVWLAVFGVIRYAIPAEMTAAVLIVAAVARWSSARVTVAASLALALAAGLLTQSAQGRRVEFGQRWYEVEPGAFDRVQSGDVVLVDGQYPSTYLLPGQLPAGVGVHVVQKDFTGTPLLERLSDEIKGARVWVVTDDPPSQVDPVVGTIDYEDCTRIRSNVVNRRLCPVTL
ncbi:MAG: glycosyltransferase 87 family protein [Candidatus Nanopelagicales bacterium]